MFVCSSRETTEVLLAHARRWRSLGAGPGEWLLVVMALVHWDRAAAGPSNDPRVRAAAQAIGPAGLSFVAACVWPPGSTGVLQTPVAAAQSL